MRPHLVGAGSVRSHEATMNKDGFIGETDVASITGLSRSTRWRGERDGWFPKRRKLSPNRVGWLKSEIEAWVSAKAMTQFPNEAA